MMYLWKRGFFFLFLLALPFSGPHLRIAEAADGRVTQLLIQARNELEKKNIPTAMGYLRQAREIGGDAPELDVFEAELQAALKDRIEQLLRDARYHRSARRNPEALKDFREVLRLDPENPEAKEGFETIKADLAEVEAIRNEGISIPESTGLSHDAQANSIELLLVRARTNMSQGRLVEAQKYAMEILERDPAHKEAKQLCNDITREQNLRDVIENAHANLRSKKLFQAVTDFDVLIRENPDRIDYIFQRGRGLLGLGRYSEAIRDFRAVLLWKPIPGNRDQEIIAVPRNEVLPFLAQAYLGNSEPMNAYAVSVDPATGRAFQSLYFRLTCHLRSFPATWAFFGIFLVLLFAAVAWAWTQFDALVGIVPPGDLFEFAKWFVTSMAGFSPGSPQDLLKLGKCLKLPLATYALGLTYLDSGDFERALDRFQVCIDHPAYSVRGFFFLGLIRKELRQPLYDHDFEQAVVLGMKDLPEPFIPKIYRAMESDLIRRFSEGKQSTVGPMEKMGRKIIATLCS